MNSIESRLVAQVQSRRDMVSFRTLVTKYQERIYFLIRRMVGSHEDAQDLVQETFIRSLKKIDQLKDPGKFGAWVHHIAVNLVLDFKRRKSSNGKVALTGDMPPKLFAEKPAAGDGTGSSELVKKEIRNRIDEALLKLPVNHREAFILFHYQELPLKLIAEYFGCPESTARSYIFRAIKKLRIYLEDYYMSTRE